MSATVQAGGAAAETLRDRPMARYQVLAASCLLTFGSYYCFDMPSVLEDQITFTIISKASFAEGGEANTYYNLFYLVYAWTNCVMSLFAGLLVDRWGIAPSVFLFLAFCLGGQALYALGPTLGSSLGPDAQYIAMFVGRFVFGLGGGAITIAQNTISAYWFAGRELAMAFGCTLTISRLGSVINFNLTTLIFNSIFGMLSSKPEYHVFCAPNSTANPWLDGTDATIDVNGTVTLAPSVVAACRNSLAATFWFGDGLILLSFGAAVFWLVMHRAETRAAAAAFAASAAAETGELSSALLASGGAKPRRRMRLSDVGRLPASYWLIALLISIFYSQVFPYMAIAKSFITDAKFASGCRGRPDEADCLAEASNAAGSVASIVYLMSACVSPFLGRAVDYFGRRDYLAILGTGICIPTFLILSMTSLNPILPMVMLGAAYCVCAAVLWPAVQFLVDPSVVGTANGIATSIQMLGIGIVNLIVGQLMDRHTSKHGDVDYAPTMNLFAALACVSLVGACGLKAVDAASGGRMHDGKRDEMRREARRQQLLAQQAGESFAVVE